MGVLDRARAVSGLDSSNEEPEPYVCLACETTFEVQHHSCPTCGSYDIRLAKWVDTE